MKWLCTAPGDGSLPKTDRGSDGGGGGDDQMVGREASLFGTGGRFKGKTKLPDWVIVCNVTRTLR